MEVLKYFKNNFNNFNDVELFVKKNNLKMHTKGDLVLISYCKNKTNFENPIIQYFISFNR